MDSEPDFAGERSSGWLSPFEAAGHPALIAIWTRYGPLTVESLERHDAVTQTFVCLSGAPAVLVVAQGSPTPGLSAVPDLAELRAFVVHPGQGFTLTCGTWHAPDRMPLHEPGTEFVCFSDRETTLGQYAEEGRLIGTQLAQALDLWGREPTVGVPG
jgi:ureidoglycolate hydrolase